MSDRPSIINPPATGKYPTLDDRSPTSELVAVGPGYLTVLIGISAGKSYPIGANGLLLGRDHTCDVWLPEDDVSRRHAQVTRLDDSSVVVRDLGSKNGVRVNGSVVREQRLQEGDLVMLGTHTVVLFSHLDPSRSPAHQTRRLESLGQFAGGVAYDFHNLFATVLDAVNRLAATPVPEAELRRCQEQVRVAAEQGAALTQRLLIFAGAVPLERVPVPVHDLVREALALAVPRFSPTVTIVRSEIADELVVLGDPPLLRQLLVNILVNAGEAVGSEGRIAISAAAHEVATAADELPIAAGRYALLEIADSGRGMSEATRARIFEPFFTTKERERGHGVGLGLAAAVAIVQQHGGCITVDSLLGKGATFSLYLPLAAQRRYQTRERRTLGGCVLVVDDDPLVLQTTSRLLTGLGYVVLSAKGGREAAGTLQASPQVGAALLDVNMPDMNGLETLRTLRVLRPELPILVFTGQPDQDLALAMVRSGAVGILAKPASLANLQRAMERLFARAP